MPAKRPLHDWVCDNCGRKVLGRRKVPRRCHGMPMRPMGPPWLGASDPFYVHAKANPGWLLNLPDDYWISESVLERLQKIVDAAGDIKWQSSGRHPGGPISVNTYRELWT